jgi:hypothetical protein
MDVDKETYFLHLRLYNSEQLPLRDFLQYQRKSRRLQLTLKGKLGFGARSFTLQTPTPGQAICVPTISYLVQDKITEIADIVTLVGTWNKKS